MIAAFRDRRPLRKIGGIRAYASQVAWTLRWWWRLREPRPRLQLVLHGSGVVACFVLGWWLGGALGAYYALMALAAAYCVAGLAVLWRRGGSR